MADEFSQVEGFTFPDPNTITYLEFTMPMRVISEANDYGGWRVKGKRKKAQKDEAFYSLHNVLRGRKIRLPCTVHLVRVGPKKIDRHENLPMCFKAVVDGLCLKLDVDDGEEDKIRFTYDQEPCGKRNYLVKVQIISQ
jgi:hypothetical protein